MGLSMIGVYSVVVVYIILHRMVKGQLFQSSGYEIHGVRSQDMRKFNIGRSSMMIVFAMFILSALIGMVLMRSKEIVVLGITSFLILLIVIVSILYTIAYRSKLSVMNKIGESEGYFVLLLIILSMVVLDINFDTWMSILIIRILFSMFYVNSIVTVL